MNEIRTQLVDAVPEVATAVEREVDEGHRAAQIDAHNLIEILLAVATRLDPPVAL
jgi:hypothetical protein